MASKKPKRPSTNVEKAQKSTSKKDTSAKSAGRKIQKRTEDDTWAPGVTHWADEGPRNSNSDVLFALYDILDGFGDATKRVKDQIKVLEKLLKVK